MKRKKYLLISLTTMLLTSISLTMMSTPVSSTPTTLLSAETIQNETLTAGSTFQMNITVDDVSTMWGYQFNLTYDTTVLTATSYQSYSPFIIPWPSKINDTAGYVSMGASSFFGDPTGLSTVVPVPIAGINFTVDAEGDSLLDLQDTVISDVLGQPIPHEAVDGYFSSESLPTHDVAVTDVTINVTETETVLPGVVINVNVTVLNKGSSTETFDVSTYYNTTAIDTKTLTSLGSLTFGNLSFNWDTTGLSVGSIYTVKAVADLTGDEDLTNNELTVDYPVQLGTRDVAIIDVTTANVTKPNPMLVNVTVKNKGNMTETFDVKAFYDTTRFGVQTVTQLLAGANTTLIFTLNTTGIEVGDYEIVAKALPGVPTETNLDDNQMSGGTIHIGVPSGYPEAHFTKASPDSPLVGQTVTFDGSASIDNDTATTGDPDGAIVSYAWDFGDGTTKIYTGANLTATANHTYTERGTFTVTLTVTDNASQSDIAIHDVQIFEHDIAVITVTPAPTQVSIGENVTITVTVGNEGDYSETFNMSVYYDTTLIETQTNISLPSGTKELTSTWDTTGVAAGEYAIKAEVTQVLNETDTADNTKTSDDIVTVGVHDIAVTSVSVSSTKVTIGNLVTINSTVKNQGNFTETFDVTVYYDNTEISTETVTDLAANASEILTFTWNTTGVDAGEYQIKATAETVTGETDTADNTKTSDDTVTVEEAAAPTIPDIFLYAAVGIVVVVVIVIVIYIWKIRKP